MDFKSILETATRTVRSVSIILDAQSIETIRKAEADILALPAATSLGDGERRASLMATLTAARETAEASRVEFRLRAPSGKDWAPLMATKPTGDGDMFAAEWYAWVCKLVSIVCIDPVMTPEQVDELADALPMTSWNELSDAAWGICSERAAIPKSALPLDETGS